ncbi:polysaccharide deacetylase family protein [Deinococcus sp. VB343]|uniref:polysaccharide deacetylase family protein n=1 Tax=Deinococcus sp. VB343 TaxID=3385567 RepID=UPI0039C8C49B
MKRGLKRSVLGALALYIGLPYLLVQVGNLGLVREGKRARREVALTFDDGPDPATTPAVLDALREAGMQATFFVVAGQARAHPDLIARMLSEGHQVEAHAEKHVHAWIRTPWGAALDPLRAVRGVETVTGQRVKFHRPPHGAYTLATLLGQRLAGVRGAHWSIEGRDWHAASTPETVRERLGALLVPGAVIVLHDAGPGARVTVPLLPGLLSDLQARGYRSVRLDALDGAGAQGWPELKRRGFLALDAVFDQLGGIRFAGGRADNLFRIARVPFPLSGMRLADGTPVAQGTPALEFHVNNPILVDLGPRASVRQARREDFRVVARELQTRPEFADVEYVFCLSAVSPLLGLLGFANHDLPASDARRLQRWANVLRFAYGNDPNAKAPQLSVLTRAEFLRRYG